MCRDLEQIIHGIVLIIQNRVVIIIAATPRITIATFTDHSFIHIHTQKASEKKNVTKNSLYFFFSWFYQMATELNRRQMSLSYLHTVYTVAFWNDERTQRNERTAC